MEGFNDSKELAGIYTVAIIGGGAIGCAILRQLTLSGIECILLEKEDTLLGGASAGPNALIVQGNAGILHSGYDATPGSIEAHCIREGNSEIKSLRKKLKLPILESSCVVIAETDEQLRSLPEHIHTGHKNGVSGVRLLTREELKQLEPQLNPDVKGGMFVPGEYVADPFALPLFYAGQALENRAKVVCSCEVLEGSLTFHQNRSKYWTLKTNRTDEFAIVEAQVVVNCAGLRADIVESINKTPGFEIRPRKGQFLVYDRPAAELVKGIISPVRTERSKGVLLYRNYHGQLIVGPTAEETEDRRSTAVDPVVSERLREVTHLESVFLCEVAETRVPALANMRSHIIGSYVGIRPATEHADYQIKASKKQQWVTVAGVRSTGLTGALGIAHYVDFLFRNTLGVIRAPIKTPLQIEQEGRKLMKRILKQLEAGQSVIKLSGAASSYQFEVTHPMTRMGFKLKSIDKASL